MNSLQAEFNEEKVILPPNSTAKELRGEGYGEWDDKVGLVLSPYEALYLVEKNRVKLVDKKTKEFMDFLKISRIYHAKKPEFLTSYLVYKDLREKGYIPREGRNGDFEVFKKGGGAKYAVVKLREGETTPVSQLVEKAEIAKEQGMPLILVVVDRRNEIVYYRLSSNFPAKL